MLVFNKLNNPRVTIFFSSLYYLFRLVHLLVCAPAITSTSTQKPKNGFVKTKGSTQPPPQPSYKEKKNVELPTSTIRSNKIKKKTSTSLKGKAPMR